MSSPSLVKNEYHKKTCFSIMISKHENVIDISNSNESNNKRFTCMLML